MNLYLVRHPQPLDVAGLCYGRQEVRIDAGSLARTAASVRRLIGDAALVHGPIFSSPSTRCLLLARELASPREPTQVDELMEMDFGSWEGVRWDAVPRGELDAWADDVWHYRPGGAESAALVAERWLRWSAMLRRPESGTAVDTAVGTAVGAAVGTAVGTAVGAAVGTAVGTAAGTAVGTAAGTAVGTAAGTVVGTAAGTVVGTAVAVTHAGLIRVALRCAGLSSAAAFSQAVVDYGSVHRIELEDEWVSA